MNDPRAKRARPTSPVEALLFDLDGTLVDSEPFHRQTLRAIRGLCEMQEREIGV